MCMLLVHACSLLKDIGVGTTGAPGTGAPLDFLVEIYLWCAFNTQIITKCLMPRARYSIKRIAI